MSDDSSYTCPHCWQEHKTFAGMTFGEVLGLRHNQEHLKLKVELLQMQNCALQEENEQLREALKPFARMEDRCLGRHDVDYEYVLISHIRAAAAAIRETSK
jgi:hypothetical protein